MHLEFLTNFRPFNIIRITLKLFVKFTPKPMNLNQWGQLKCVARIETLSDENVKIQQIGDPQVVCFGCFLMFSSTKA